MGRLPKLLGSASRVTAAIGHSIKLCYTSNHTVTSMEYYPMVALAEHALALRYQHLILFHILECF